MRMAEQEDVNARNRPAGIPKSNLHGFLLYRVNRPKWKKKEKKKIMQTVFLWEESLYNENWRINVTKINV